MKNRIKFIIIMMMVIVCTMMAKAQKNVYFATYRTITNEYGEMLPKSPKEAYCPTRIEVNWGTNTLFIKTKTHGSASYTFSSLRVVETGVGFYDENGELIGNIGFADTEYSKFNGLVIYRKDDTHVSYLNIDVF